MSPFQQFQQKISDEMSLSFEKDGYSPLVGRIMALLLFATEPVSLQDMAETIGVSKAAVSVQARKVEQNHMCRRVTQSSDRKDYYFIEEGFSFTMVSTIVAKMQYMYQKIENHLKLFPDIDVIKEEDHKAYVISKSRLLEMMALHQLFIERMEGFEQEWAARRESLIAELSIHKGKTE